MFHHEQAGSVKYPSALFFYCETPATVGGGTGVSPSWALHDALAAAHPSFLADCAAKGVIYRGILPYEHDATKGSGRSWRSYFAARTKEEAEARMTALGYAFEWRACTGGDVLHFTTPVLPAVMEVEGPRGPKTRVFFNQLVAQALANAAEFQSVGGGGGGEGSILPFAEEGEAMAPSFVTFGDGSPVPLAPLLAAQAACEAASVDIQWRAGDVGLLDNMLVLHARRGYEGPRRVLASLVQ